MGALKEKIRLLRTLAGMSQGKLAESLGVVRQTVSRWEKGTAVPAISDIEKMCSLFGVQAGYFLNEETQETDAVSVHERLLESCRAEISVAMDRRSYILFSVFAAIVSLMFAAMLLLTVRSAIVTFSPMDGVTVKDFTVTDFVIFTVISVLLAVADVLLIVRAVKKHRKICQC